jgi:hypothetical protein
MPPRSFQRWVIEIAQSKNVHLSALKERAPVCQNNHQDLILFSKPFAGLNLRQSRKGVPPAG